MKAPRVPVYDLAGEYHLQKEAIDAAMARVLDSGVLTLGPELEAFEDEFARFCGTRHAVGVASGTAALHLALLACGVGPGDEVITVPNTDIPTTMAITHCGATIVWVDVDPKTFTLDPARLAEKITPRTKALLPVHLFGHPADMDPILEVGRAHGVTVIEDAALATGATYKGRNSGALGDVACFSLAPTKVLGAFGDAGIVTTNDAAIADRIKVLRNYGHDLRMENPVAPSTGLRLWRLVAEGFNERLDALQAAVLRVKLEALHERIERRREIAHGYTDRLQHLNLVVPYEAPGVTHVYRAYPILVEHRDQVRTALGVRGIATHAYYTPLLHEQPAYIDRGEGRGSFPVAESIADRLVCLPIFPTISTQQIEEVLEAVETVVPMAVGRAAT
jgi:dTDP-4-amino-4,6-dideoxygalactose transaminase